MDTPSDKLEKWRGYVPDNELETYRKSGFAQPIGMGRKAALLNIDTTYIYVDPAHSMCGREMDDLIEALNTLTQAFRDLGLPIYYSRRDDRSHPTYRDAWNQKLQDPDAFQYARDPRADQWPESYGPRAEDRLIICGVSTPGCVRSGAVDAFSHNFRSIIVADACGDRSPQAHKANLFDLDMKFGDVETLTDTIAELKKRYA